MDSEPKRSRRVGYSRRQFLARSGGTLAASLLMPGALVACGSNGENQGDTGSQTQGGTGSQTLSFSYQPAAVYGLFYVAKQKGWFREAGLENMPLKIFQSGAPQMEAMAGGGIEAGCSGAVPALVTAASGIFPLKVISIVDNNSNIFSIVSDESIQSVPDLAGKRVATTLGTNFQYYLAKVLSKFDMTLDDVELVDSQPVEAQEAFLAGEVAALVPLETSRVLILDQKPDAKVLFETSQFPEPPNPMEPFRLFDLISAPERIVQEKGEALRNLLEVFHGRVTGYIESQDSRGDAISEVAAWQRDVLNTEDVSEQDLRDYFGVLEFYNIQEAKKIMTDGTVESVLTDSARFLAESGQTQDVPDISSVISTDLINSL